MFKRKMGTFSKLKLFLSFVALASIFLFCGQIAKASDFFFLKEVSYPLESDYILKTEDGLLSLNVLASSTNDRFYLKMSNLARQDSINQFFTYPESSTPATDLYSIRLEGSKDITFTKQPRITLTYTESNKFNQLYYYDWYNLKFEKLDTVRDTIKHTLQFDFPAGKQSLQFAIFNEPELIGRASWYVHPKYENDLIAASVDFAKDTKLRVINLDNNKEVIVTVKDYGPKKCSDWTAEEQRKMGPCQERILDLSQVAFKKIASTSQGVIRVKAIPIE